jgi:hypothetical protein
MLNSSQLRRCLSRLALLAGLLMVAGLPTAAAESGSVLKTVHPIEIDEPMNNPYMGWGLWAGPRYFDGRPFTLEYNTTGFGDDAPLFSWVLIDWMWADLEPQEGKYYWKDLDTIIHYWGGRGKQIYLRVWVTDDPGWNGAPGNEVCPEWLWASGARYREYVGEGKSKKREPDYIDPSYERIYLPKVRKFLTALAEQYDKPGVPLNLWGVMGYGQWGEWHTLWSHYPWPNAEVKHDLLAKIVNMYADIFRLTQPCISYVHDNDLKQVKDLEDFMYRQALDVALPKGFALARHGFIDGLGYYDKKVMEKFWRQSPMLFEGNWSYSDVRNHGTHGTLDENMQIMLEWHSNYAHFYMDADSYKRAVREDRTYFEKGLRSGGLGYRLVPLSASWREELPAGNLFLLNQTWVNRNVGRCYKRFPLKVYLTDTQGKDKFSEVDRGFGQTDWAQGETYKVTSVLHLPKDLTPGVYEVRIAMVDEAGNPRVDLGIQGVDSRKRYKLGTVQILPLQSQIPCDRSRCP